MTLTFTQENGLYVAEFEATAPFSIHLERPKGGFINMLQRSVDSGTFVAVKNFNPNYNATQVIDADCGQGAVYPKWIRLESAVEPTLAEMVEGEQSGGGAGESTMEYLDVSGGGMAAQASMLYAYLWKAIVAENVGIFPIGVIISTTPSAANSVSQIAIDFSTEVNKSAGGTEIMTIKEAIMSLYSVTEEELAAIPRITKEQFYSLEA